jgi:AAA+ superfamily predicted ATPase
VIILSSGPPGVGKTLTAEAYSERARRPLYTVQCAQLGVTAEELESRLGKVLARARKWGCILLIDEADVYIHERGSNVNQNAIVGVFLRLLEYYQGVLFLTTNRETTVDDAIRSRCVAHVRYKLPDSGERFKLWGLYAAQYGLELDRDLVHKLVKTLSKLSGRSIKQLCRITKTVHVQMKRELNLDLFEWVARFQDIEQHGDEEEGV